MKLIDRAKTDWGVVMRLKGKKRWEFIWDYYKLPILGLLLLALILGLSLGNGLRRQKVAVYAVFVNAEEGGDNEALDALLRAGGWEKSGGVGVEAQFVLSFDDTTGLSADTIQVLAALFGIGDLDVFAADEPVFLSYASQEAFVDLSYFLEPEELARFQTFTYQGEGGRTVVAGLLLPPGSPLHEAGYYTEPVYIGAAANAQNLDAAVAFLKGLAAAMEG